MQKKIFDRNHNVLAVATIEERGDHFFGTADTAAMPSHLRWMFERYEKLVDDQVLSMLDVIEGEIAKLEIFTIGPDGVIVQLEKVQLFPKAGTISFREGLRLTY